MRKCGPMDVAQCLQKVFYFFSEFFDLAGGIFFGRPLVENTVAGVTGDYVEMNMFD